MQGDWIHMTGVKAMSLANGIGKDFNIPSEMKWISMRETFILQTNVKPLVYVAPNPQT